MTDLELHFEVVDLRAECSVLRQDVDNLLAAAEQQRQDIDNLKRALAMHQPRPPTPSGWAGPPQVLPLGGMHQPTPPRSHDPLVLENYGGGHAWFRP